MEIQCVSHSGVQGAAHWTCLFPDKALSMFVETKDSDKYFEEQGL